VLLIIAKVCIRRIVKTTRKEQAVNVTRMQEEKNKRPACTAKVVAPVWEKKNYVHRTVDAKVATMVKAKTKKYSTKREMMFLTRVVLTKLKRNKLFVACKGRERKSKCPCLHARKE